MGDICLVLLLLLNVALLVDSGPGVVKRDVTTTNSITTTSSFDGRLKGHTRNLEFFDSPWGDGWRWFDDDGKFKWGWFPGRRDPTTKVTEPPQPPTGIIVQAPIEDATEPPPTTAAPPPDPTIPQFCVRKGTVYTPHPKTKCEWFDRREGEEAVSANAVKNETEIQSSKCPRGLMFSVITCTCTWPWPGYNLCFDP